MAAPRYEVVIVGGGPAGLAAALFLGRCRRRVVLCDDGRPRNVRARASHGFFTRDGAAPRELVGIGRAQLAPYDVELVDGTATDVQRLRDGFRVRLAGGRVLSGRMLLLATGLVDELPPVRGAVELYGTALWHCPYCDGWEVRDEPLAIYARGRKAVETAMGFVPWSRELVLVTDGERVGRAGQAHLAREGIALRSEPVRAFVRLSVRRVRLEFAAGPPLVRRGIFFDCGTRQRSRLAERLGCSFNERGHVATGRFESTNVPGLFVAGDASRDVNFISVAAAEGTRAGFAIHRALRRADHP